MLRALLQLRQLRVGCDGRGRDSELGVKLDLEKKGSGGWERRIILGLCTERSSRTKGIHMWIGFNSRSGRLARLGFFSSSPPASAVNRLPHETTESGLDIERKERGGVYMLKSKRMFCKVKGKVYMA